MPLQLTRPDSRYRESYLAALHEYAAEGQFSRDALQVAERAIDPIIQRLCSKADPRHTLPFRVPETLFWLVNDNQFLGNTSIRHFLNDHLLALGGHIGYDIRPSARRQGFGTAILRLVLPEARKLGFARVLITCNDTNTGSRKVIEANGGIFENAMDGEEDGTPIRKLRYWINLI